MARSVTLGIKIQVQGQEKVIKSVQELETEIEKLSQELKTLEFGSPEFKNAADNLGKLKAGLRDVDKQIEGVDREQTIEGFSAAVNGVTGAFLIASSAARTFGADSESVENIAKAEQAALEGVNIALGVQALAELAVKREKILGLAVKARDFIATQLNTAAQTAYTVAVGASTGALRAFRIALATTGVGALVVGLGFLVSKLFDTKEETEEVNENLKELKDFQLEAAQAARVEELQILQLQTALNDSNTTVDEKKELYKELQKLVPELSNLTYEQAEAEDAVNTAINTQINLIRLRAKQKALEDFIVQQEKERIAAEAARREQEKQAAAIRELVETQEAYQRALKGGTQITFEEFEAQEKLRKSLQIVDGQLVSVTEATDEQSDATQNLTEEEKLLLEVTQEIADEQSKVTKRTTTRTKATNEQTEADKAAAKAAEEYAKNITELADAFADISFEGEASVKVLDDANKIIEKQTALLERRGDILKSEKKNNEEFTQSLRELIGGLVIPDENVLQLEDVFKRIFTETNEEIFDLGITNSRLQQQQLLKNIEIYGVEKLRKEIGDESLDALLDYFQTSVNLTDSIKEYNEGLNETDKKTKSIKNENLDVAMLVKEIGTIQNNRLNFLISEEEANQNIKELVSERLFNTRETFNLSEEQLKILDSVTETLLSQSTIYQQIESTNEQLNKLTKQIDDNIESQTKKLEDTTGLENFIEQNRDRIDEIQEYFSTLTTENSNLTEEQLNNINNLIDNIETENLLQDINDIGQAIISVFQDVSGRISAIVSQQNSLALEQLAYQEEQTLATIGDATEDAAAEQERARKEFARKRFELEKSSRVTELQFSIADAIANGASAVLNALATVPFPASIGVSALYGAITAAQVATINSQLQFTKSKQFIGRRGGLLVGNSHENGGIMANGGLVLEGGEAVINRNAVAQFSDLLSQISTSTGGRPLVGDDSRIVEEIRRQNQRPIKTYVLDRDIQNTRKINDRLSQLSRL